MTSKRKVTKYCIIATCFNRATMDPDLTFFTLPKDAQRRQQWLLLADRDDLLYKENLNIKSYCICSAHFDRSSMKIIRHLNDDAVPSFYLPNQPTRNSLQSDCGDKSLDNVPNEAQSSVGLAQSSSASIQYLKKEEMVNKSTQISGNVSKRKNRKRKPNKLRVPENKRSRLEEAVIKIEKELEAKNASLETDAEDEIIRRFRALFDWQNKMKDTFKGYGYEAEYQMFSVNLYCSSPQTYHCLQTVLNLPNKSTLNKFKFKIGAEINDHVIDSLSFKLKSLPEKAKYCTLCIDKLELKPSLYYDTKKDKVTGCSNIDGKMTSEIAFNAYVIMLQGIYLNWKQPITYSFFTKYFIPYLEIDKWIFKVIQKLFEIGIEVKALISSQDLNDFAKITKEVTVGKPYFIAYGRKIYYIFDAPHLLKCTRDYLISKDLVFEGNKISWDHVRTLFAYQKDKNFKLMPKITKAHVKPNCLQRKNLQYAAQIFSNTVSAALETYIDFGKITEQARATATFFKAMNDIFDILNSSIIISHTQLQTAFCMSEEQMKVLEEAKYMFANMESAVHVTEDRKIFYNFQITIQSMLLLFKDLKSEGPQFLCTRKLNKDNLDIFFGAIKQEVGSSKPTPIQFTRAFSKLLASYMLKSSPSTKREPDIFQLLLIADDIKNKVMTSSEEPRTSLVSLNGDIDYRMDFPNDHDLTFVASFLLLKCFEQHKDCVRLTDRLQSVPRLITDKLKIYYIKYIESSSIFRNMQKPSAEFKQCIQMLDKVFTENLRKCVTGNVGSTLFELLKACNLPMLYCSCFPVDYLLKLFVRFRIYTTLKYNNYSFRNAKTLKNNMEIQSIKVKPLGLQKTKLL